MVARVVPLGSSTDHTALDSQELLQKCAIPRRPLQVAEEHRRLSRFILALRKCRELDTATSSHTRATPACCQTTLSVWCSYRLPNSTYARPRRQRRQLSIAVIFSSMASRSDHRKRTDPNKQLCSRGSLRSSTIHRRESLGALQERWQPGS